MSREVAEGQLGQGADEQIRYKIAANPAPVTVGAVTVIDEITGENVTTAVTTGQPSLQDGYILMPILRSLEVGHLYRVEVQYSDGFNTLEPFFRVWGER